VESNHRLNVGNVVYCHCTTPALFVGYAFKVCTDHQFVLTLALLSIVKLHSARRRSLIWRRVVDSNHWMTLRPSAV
jgi:hypothetical protein